MSSSLAEIDYAATCAIRYYRPLGISDVECKRLLATRWLRQERPKGLLQRAAWVKALLAALLSACGVPQSGEVPAPPIPDVADVALADVQDTPHVQPCEPYRTIIAPCACHVLSTAFPLRTEACCSGNALEYRCPGICSRGAATIVECL